MTPEQTKTLLALRSDATELTGWINLALRRNSLHTVEQVQQRLTEMLDKADELLDVDEGERT